MTIKKENTILLIMLLCYLFTYSKAEAGALKLPWVCECMTEQGKFEIKNFQSLQQIQMAGQPLIISFGTENCRECKQYKNLARDLYKEMFGWVKIKFVDTDTNKIALESLPVSDRSFQFFFHSTGNPFVPSEELQETMDFVLYRDPQSQKHLYTFHKGFLTENQLRNIIKDLD